MNQRTLMSNTSKNKLPKWLHVNTRHCLPSVMCVETCYMTSAITTRTWALSTWKIETINFFLVTADSFLQTAVNCYKWMNHILSVQTIIHNVCKHHISCHIRCAHILARNVSILEEKKTNKKLKPSHFP